MEQATPARDADGRPGLLGLAAATPESRDRYVDFLRAFSILVVVFGHWLIAVVTWKDGKVGGANALELIDGIWVLTWVLQVMPLFFFVGGFSNLRSWEAGQRRGEGYAVFLYTRTLRMMRPTIVFLGVGLVVITILDAFNVADDAVFPSSELIARPLWFLGVYMIVVSVAPAMARLHRQYGVKVPLAMLAIAAAVDITRFGFDISAISYVNYPVVWLMAHQLGFFYADGTLARARRWLLGGAFISLLALVNLGPYPGSMVGLSRDEFSNMDPPTLAIAALILGQVGLAMVFRASISRWLQRLRVWAAVIYVNAVIMTVFLWHLTALLFGIGILFPLGFPQPEAGSAQWWALRPVWIGLLMVLLAVLVLAFGRFEARGLQRMSAVPSRAARSATAAAQAALGTVLLVLGILGFAMGGLHQLFAEGTELIVFNLNPMLSLIHLLIGWILVSGSIRGVTIRVAMSAVAAGGLAVLAILGWLSSTTALTDRLALNTADTWVHVSVGVATLVVGVAGPTTGRREVPGWHASEV